MSAPAKLVNPVMTGLDTKIIVLVPEINTGDVFFSIESAMKTFLVVGYIIANLFSDK